MQHTFSNQFARAGLRLIDRSADTVQQSFFIGIRTGRDRRHDAFVLYCGTGNTVIVINTDATQHQVVLRVNLPEQINDYYGWDNRKGRNRLHRQRIPAESRTYLLGRDRTHLFVTQLPAQHRAINTVAEAHRALQPPAIHRHPGKTYRQGEWFFVPLTPREEWALITLMQTTEVREHVSLGGQHPHIAQYQIGDFVKGRITHSQHRTVTLRGWYRAVHNVEVAGRRSD